MNNDAQLPADVIEEIHAGRKIEAIKRLREHNGSGLKAAKTVVDQYVRDHPQRVVQRQGGSGTGLVLTVLVVAAVGGLLWFVFS